MSEGTATVEVPRWQRGLHLLLVAAAATATLLSALLVVTISNNRAFQVDEVEHIHAAYQVAVGKVLYRDVYEAHTPGLYLTVAPFIDVDDPVVSYGRARVLMLLMLLATIALAARLAAKLRGPQAAWLVATGLLVHSTFVERGMEVRPDGALALAVLGSLALTTTTLRVSTVHLLQGVIMGAAFVFTQKAAIATFGFGLVWLGTAVRQRDWRLVVWPCLAWAVPIFLVAGAFAAVGALEPFIERNLANPVRVASRSRGLTMHFSPMPFLQLEGARNPVFYCVAVAGLAGATALAITRPAARRSVATILVVGWVSFVGLWINPYPFPYFHVPIIAVLAVVASTLLPETWLVGSAGSIRRWAVAVVTIVALGWWSVPRLADRTRLRADIQFEHLRRTQAVTGPDDTVLDLVGLYFRQDAYPVWVMTGVMLARYGAGEYPPMIETLRQSRPSVVGLNYRMLALPDDERRFISEHYAHGWGNLYVLGCKLDGLTHGEERTIELLSERLYRWTGEPGAVEVDGAPFSLGVLAAGTHRVRAVRAVAEGSLRIKTPWDDEPPFPPRGDLYVNFE